MGKCWREKIIEFEITDRTTKKQTNKYFITRMWGHFWTYVLLFVIVFMCQQVTVVSHNFLGITWRSRVVQSLQNCSLLVQFSMVWTD